MTVTSYLTPAERAYYRRLAALRTAQGRHDLAAACLRIANRPHGKRCA